MIILVNNYNLQQDDVQCSDNDYHNLMINYCQVGTVSILVNNAGIVSGSALLDTPDNRSLLFSM